MLLLLLLLTKMLIFGGFGRVCSSWGCRREWTSSWQPGHEEPFLFYLLPRCSRILLTPWEAASPLKMHPLHLWTGTRGVSVTTKSHLSF